MWIKVETKLRNSPKLYTIAMRMGVSRITALGAVCEAWMIADSHAEGEGFLKHLTFEALDEMIGVKNLGIAMNEVGWLVEVKNGISFVDYTNITVRPLKQGLGNKKTWLNLEPTRRKITRKYLMR